MLFRSDDEATDDATRRRLSTEIIRLCDEVDHALDEQVESFDALRDLQQRVPEVLTELATRAAEITQRVPRGRTALTQLATTYPATSLASVATNADQAAALVAAAEQQVGLGQEALTSGDRATAVTHARAAEGSLAQATTLLAAVDTAGADLEAAAASIAARQTSLGSDLDDAARLAPDVPGVQGAADAARRALSYAVSPDHDPLAAVQRLAHSEAALDDVLAAPRAAAAEAAKAREAQAALRKSAKDHEARAGKLAQQISAIDRAMFDPASADPALAKLKMGDLSQRRGKLASELETVEAAWMDALEAIETAAA